MTEGETPRTARERLLYDDAAPRLRSPVAPTMLTLRRPALLVAPAAFVLSVAIPAAGAATVVAPLAGAGLRVVGSGLAGLLVLALAAALLLSRREEGSFAFLSANLLMVTHALVGMIFVAAIVAAGPLGMTQVAGVLAQVPGPAVDGFILQLAKAYCVLFLVATAASLGAAIVFRWIGLRRVIAGKA